MSVTTLCDAVVDANRDQNVANVQDFIQEGIQKQWAQDKILWAICILKEY